MKNPHRTKEELEELACQLVDQLRKEMLPLWQAKEVLERAKARLEWEVLK